jgi:hypothetical protein
LLRLTRRYGLTGASGIRIDADIGLALGRLDRRSKEAVLIDRNGIDEPGERAIIVV